jgi:hypothetical protein
MIVRIVEHREFTRPVVQERRSLLFSCPAVTSPNDDDYGAALGVAPVAIGIGMLVGIACLLVCALGSCWNALF